MNPSQKRPRGQQKYSSSSSAANNNKSTSSSPVKRRALAATTTTTTTAATVESIPSRASRSSTATTAASGHTTSNRSSSRSRSSKSVPVASVAEAGEAAKTYNICSPSQLAKIRTLAGHITAQNFLTYFKDPPHVERLLDPCQRDRLISIYIKQESRTQPPPSSPSNPTINNSDNKSGPLLRYRKLSYLPSYSNQLRIFLAVVFLKDQLRIKANLKDPKHAFRITTGRSNKPFKSLANELELAYTHNPPPPALSTSSSLSLPTPTLFQGVTPGSLQGLYRRTIVRARELRTFEASPAAQDDPWTPTKLSVIAMELLDLHDQVHERYMRIKEARMMSVGRNGEGVCDNNNNNDSDSDNGNGNGNDKGGGKPNSKTSDVRSGKSKKDSSSKWEQQFKALLDEEFIAEGPPANQILVHSEESDSYECGGNNNDSSSRERAYLEEKEEMETAAAATIVTGSGLRDDLWEVVTVQARTFQELTDEVVQLREEVAQLRRKDVRREFEMASKFRAVEDKFVFIQEEVLKLKLMDGREP